MYTSLHNLKYLLLCTRQKFKNLVEKLVSTLHSQCNKPARVCYALSKFKFKIKVQIEFHRYSPLNIHYKIALLLQRSG